MSVTEEIKNRLDLVDVVSESVTLRKSGRSYAGFCPFHPNSKTPSFYVFPHTQTWHCFGACAEGGDLFSFVMKREGLDFKEALEKLAQKAGVTLEEPEERSKSNADQKWTDLLAAAADYYHQLFLHAPQAAHARAYVEKRGLTEETVATFGLGFALDSWSSCRDHFMDQGYTVQELLHVGLLTEHPEKHSTYDRFRGRLMVPIRDPDGRTVGFGARTLDPAGLPKYLNSPQTAVFDKGRLLFGLDLGRRHIREARQVVIVEGYMDVIQAWQAGFRNVVGQMGTALTPDQLQLLKRYTKRFVLALDGDSAGQKATLRSLQVARETLDHEVETRFDVRGLVQHEARLQADIRIMTLPEGDDPDSLIRQDPVRWIQLIAEAKPVVAYVIEIATQGLDMNDAKAKTAMAQEILPLIKEVADPLERTHYQQVLAHALRVDERTLDMLALSLRGKTASRASANAPLDPATLPKVKNGVLNKPAVRVVTLQAKEANYLCQCLHYPQVMLAVNQKLAQNGQTAVAQGDFTLAEDRALWQALFDRVTVGNFATIDELCDSLDKILINRVQLLLKTTPPAPASEVTRLPDTLALSVLQWRLDKIKGHTAELQQLFRETPSQTSPELAQLYSEKIRESHGVMQSIHKAMDAMSAMSRRRSEAVNGR